MASTPPAKPGDAWKWNGKKWVKPPVPQGLTSTGSGKNTVWNDNEGWVTRKAAANAYGYPLAVIASDKSGSLSRIFNRAWQAELKGSAWSQQKFTAEINASTWAINRSNTTQAFDALASNPAKKAEYQAQLDKAKNDVLEFATQEGITLSGAEAAQIGKDKLRFGYSAADLSNIFGHYKHNGDKDYTDFFKRVSGTTGVGADKTTILDWAKQNGVTVSDSWVGQQLSGIESNQFDVQKSKDYITGLAKLSFPAHADQIDAKNTVMDRAQTYAQKISTMLEVPYESIDLSNQHLQNALHPGEDGKPKNLTQVEQELRGTADWGNTNNAKETSNTVVNGILSKFGLI